jgi:putative peptidoglycan lipid II flippase
VLKFLNSESKSIVGAATLVGILSFAADLAGLIRDRILAGTFGAGDVLDAYYAAFKVPDLLFSLIVVGALSAGFIPVFTRHWTSVGGKERAWRLTSHALSALVGLMAIVGFAVAIFSPQVAAIVAPGFAGRKLALVAALMRVMLLAQVVFAASIVFGSVLQGLKRFVLYAAAPVLYNVGIIVGATWLVKPLGPMGLAWGVVLGATMHALLQAFGVIQAGWRPSFKRPILDADVREVFKLTGPRVLGIAVSQLLFVVLTVIATTLERGSVTVFQFAYNIQFVPVAIVGVSFAIAAFPSLAEHAGSGSHDRFVDTFVSSVRQVLFLIAPLAVLFLVVRAQVVRVVVGAGVFDWPATIRTADALAFFALSFVPQSIAYLLSRAFFALKDTMTPLTVGLVSGLLGIVTALWLSGPFGASGLALAFSLASFANAAILWVVLRGRVGTLHESQILPTVYKVAAASVVALVVMQATKSLALAVVTTGTFFGVLGQGLIAGGAGLVAYAIVAYALRTKELADLLEGMKRKVVRKAAPVEMIPPSDGSPSA